MPAPTIRELVGKNNEPHYSFNGPIGSIEGLTRAQIKKILGFAPETGGDKCDASWTFCVGRMVRENVCSVEDWKGSGRSKVWSAFGNADHLSSLFGAAFVNGTYR